MGSIIAGVRPIDTGSEASPGLPFAESPLNGIYRPSPSDGFGIAINGKKQFDLFSTGFKIGNKPDTTFAISAVSGSPFPVNVNRHSWPFPSIAGAHLFAWGSNNNIDVFAQNSVTGELTLTDHETGYKIAQAHITPTDKFVITTGDSPFGGNPKVLTVFEFDSVAGTLTFSSTVNGKDDYSADKAAISADGLFYYVTSYDSGIGKQTITSHSINPTTGSLGAAVVEINDLEAFNCASMTVSPDNKFLYAVVRSGGVYAIHVYTRNESTGGLTLTSTTVPGGTVSNMTRMFVSSDGLHLYGRNSTDTTVYGFAIDQTTGALTNVSGSPFAINCANDFNLSPDGTRLFGYGAGSVVAASRNAVTGEIVAVGAGIALTGTGLTSTPDENFVYLFDSGVSLNVNILQTSAAPTFNLLDLIFDPLGFFSGIFGINGTLKKNGVSVLNQTEGDARYQLASAQEWITGVSVANHAALPAAASNSGLMAIVLAGSGIWPITWKARGQWRSDGATWNYLGDYTLNDYASEISGTTTNDDSAAGFLGEYTDSDVASGSAIALTTNVAKTITSISLTAGDWDVTGVIGFAEAATTKLDHLSGSISLTTDTDGAENADTGHSYAANVSANPTQTMPLPTVRFSLAGTTTIYLIAHAIFTVSTCEGWGTIRARRVR